MNDEESNPTNNISTDDSPGQDPQDVEEFSLDQLRKVYAKVIQEKRAADQPSETPSPDFSAGFNADDAVAPSPAFGSADGRQSDPPSPGFPDSDLTADGAGQSIKAATGYATGHSTDSVNASHRLTAVTDFETDDDAQVPVTPQSIVEAILFVGDPSGKKLTLKRIASVLRDVSPQEVKQIIRDLNQQYQQEHAAYRIFMEKDRVEMRLDESLHEFQTAFMGSNRPAKLAPNAIEVLAIVAYNQPIGRSRIDELRKKPSQSLLKQLEKQGLIKTAETAVETTDAVTVGKSVETADERECKTRADTNFPSSKKERQWITTAKFLEMFNLSDPAELPRSQHFDDLDELLA